ncbi:MAG: hypothetical protein GPI90_07400 [Microcystis aeruginosa K13-05]|nr:hypothetical protein [Microcystis aeruginosa K13-10]NCR84487.1 hypothetical protein [Microcystis aeruginosa K13-05]
MDKSKVNCRVRSQESGDRRQETGDRRQETGDRRQLLCILPTCHLPLATFKSGVSKNCGNLHFLR